MPEDFTTEQLRFLSKYLKPIEARIQQKTLFSKKSKREANNEEVEKALETLKSDFATWLSHKQETAQLLDQIALKYDLSLIPAQKARHEELQKRFDQIVERVRSAPAEAPEFSTASWEASMLRVEIRALDHAAEGALNALTPPPVTALFDETLEKVDALAQFEDHPVLTEKIATTPLEKASAEATRQTAYDDHKDLCDTARATIDGLKTQATQDGDIPALEKQALTAFHTLKDARQAPLKQLADAVAAGAKTQLRKLGEDGNEVAQRDQERRKRLRKDIKGLNAAMDKIDEKIEGLQEDLSEAEGFQERRGLMADILAESERRAELDYRARQMEAYRAAAPKRLELIENAQEALGFFPADSDDIDGAVTDWAQNRTGPDIVPLEDDNQADQKKIIEANIIQLSAAVARSREKIVVDAKLYPDEPDLTEISDEQAAMLRQMLNVAEGLCARDRYPEARALHDDALALWRQFVASRSFVLPDLPIEQADEAEQVQARLKEIAVNLDRLWGMGADADALRDRHDALAEQANQIAEAKLLRNEPPDYRDCMVGLDALARDVALGLKAAAQPSTADLAAQELAHQTANAISESLTKLYRTERVPEGKLGSIPPDNLLELDVEGGKAFFEIQTRDDGTIKRRKDKTIPREAIAALNQQMQMLQMMAESGAAGCAAAVTEASQKAADMQKAITEGGENYARVVSALKDFDKIMGDKKFKEWHMSGLQDLEARKTKFEDSYAGSMLPADAAAEAQGLKDEAQAKLDGVATLKEEHEAVTKKLDQIENKLAAKSKGDDPTLGKLLADLIKNGLPKIQTSTLDSIDDMARAIALESDIKNALAEIMEMGQHGTGIQGDLRKELERLRTKLGTKSEQGVATAKAGADALDALVDNTLAEMTVRPAVDPMKYLEQIAKLTTGVAKASREKLDAREKATELKAEAKAALEEVSTTLSASDSLSSKPEYKAVYESIKSRYESGSKAWNKGKGDPDLAISTFEAVVSNAEELLADLKSLTKIKKMDETVDLDGFEKALIANVRKVASAANKVAELINTQVETSEEQKADQALQTAIDKVEKVLDLVGNLEDAPKFSSKVKKELEGALALTDETARKAALAKAHAQAQSEIRLIRTHLAEDPSMKVYRDNPFDHGGSWPQLQAALLNFENQLF